MERLFDAHPALRYVIAGGVNTLFYIGLTLLLSGPVGLPIQVAIPVSFACALVQHFLFQRVFVWRHVEEFALRAHEQAVRYVVIGGIQYVVTAAIVAALPGALGVPEQAVYVVTVGCISVITFLLLRGRVFHASA